LIQSELYKVQVNDQVTWTEKYVSNLDFDKLPDWFSEAYVRKPQEQHIASFSGTGSLRVTVTVDSEHENIKIRPASRNIKPEIKNNQITFNWTGPGQLVVEVD